MLSLFVPFCVGAAISDDFDSYDVDSFLDGVGFWATTTEPAQIKTTQYDSIPNSAYFDPGGNTHHGRLISPDPAYNGIFSWSIFFETCPAWTEVISFARGGLLNPVVVAVLVVDDNSGVGCWFRDTQNDLLVQFATSTWYDLAIAWTGVDDDFLFCINGVSYDLGTSSDSVLIGIDYVNFITNSADYYIDDVRFSAYSGSYCSQFTYQGACVAAGCSWWHSQEWQNAGLYPYQGCVEPGSIPPDYESPLDPYPDQASCEAAGYFWIPGTGCYATTTDFQVDMNLFERFWDIVKDPKGFFEDLFEAFDLRKKPPFSWVIEIYGIITYELQHYEEYEPEESAFASLDVQFAGFGTTSIAFINFSYVKNQYSTQFDFFKVIIAFTIWLAFVSFVFARSRNFAERLNH